MKVKLVSIFVSMLLCVTVLSVTGNEIKNEVPSLEYDSSAMLSDDAQYNGGFTFGNKMFYGYCLASSPLPKGPIEIPSDNPGGATSIASSTVTVYAATWALDEWYAINDATKDFITIDSETGDMATVGATGITASYITTGLTYDPSTATMYASAGETVGADLFTHFYSVDLDTGVATYLGGISTPCAIIAMACDNNGNIYGPDIYDENLYLIDPITATLTLIGNTGLSLNYAQGAAYDKDEDILYLAAYTSTGGLYTCDTTTGHATLIGNFPGGEETAGLAIPYISNLPPETPSIPDGLDEGLTGVEYTFTSSTTDPEGEQIYYMFDWGDGSDSGWVGPYNSGETGSASHTWGTAGDFNVKVKAKDVNDGESGWSDSHILTILGGPILDIGVISGGLFKVSVQIENIGATEATNVQWNITLDGGGGLGGASGENVTIPAGGNATISSKLIIGLGKTTVTVSAWIPDGSSDTREQNAFVLLFIIFMKPGGG